LITSTSWKEKRCLKLHRFLVQYIKFFLVSDSKLSNENFFWLD